MTRLFFLSLLLVIIGAPSSLQQPSKPQSPIGRWQVKFTLLDSSEKNLVFSPQEGGEGSFQLLDTGPNNKPVPDVQAAAWSLPNNNLSFSGEVELPMGTISFDNRDLYCFPFEVTAG